MNVLLVEDDKEQADMVINRAQNHANGAFKMLGPYAEFGQVLPVIKSQQFQIALIDIELHQDRYAGLHIAETIQELHPVPILFISGVTEKEVVQKADRIQMSSFLQKPYDEQTFFRALNFTLQQRERKPVGGVKQIFGPRNRDRFWIKCNRSHYQKVDPKQIVCVEALDHHCRFYFRNQPPIVTSARLKSEIFEGNLSGLGSFYLLNRSTIINLDAVDQIDGNSVVLKDFKPLKHKRLIISKDRRQDLFESLGINLA